ncbi:restriction endonuclease subunit S [Coprococcus catus]|uniref:restriction endonuclease subunit S n=1 Tax=Coprococcus catus TaxID=116085 RepID=UPI001C8B5265|nr:restriction endonuclease subunit S [Coprococcus catus]MBX9231664.1 hypothetical protein [Coprococcus catus]MCT6801522.1 restriction endonuclease subunit S [Coprococcus catus]
MAMIRPETEMKDSGVKYVGLIPRTWKIVQLKYCTDCLDGKRVPIDASLRKSGIYPYWGAGRIMDYVDDYIFDEKLVLLGEDGAPFFDDFRPVSHLIDGKVWVNNHIHVLRTKDSIVDSYLVHALNSVDYHEYINGSILNKLTQSNMNRIKIPLPSIAEQQAIADYLDETCSKIDEIIAEAKVSIDEYKKLKIGQINKYTVHKMKRTKLKYITEKIGDGIHTTPEYSDEGTIRFINGGSFGEDSIKMIGPMLSNEEYQKQNKSLLNEHTVMIALNGANFGNTSLYNNETILLGKSAGYITLKPTVCREYVRYCLENSVTKEAFDLSLNGTTIPNLSLNTLRNTEICLPDYSIQKQLAKTIKKMIVKMDSLIAEKESLINDLEAYKKSLIYEVVTGKRRVV